MTAKAERDAEAEFRRAMEAPEPGDMAGPSRWQMTEAQLLAEIMALCVRLGVACVHIDTPHHNKRAQNMIGFPDLLLCGKRRMAFRELKREGPSRLRPDQTTWKYRLQAIGADWAIWQPSDLESGRIERELEAL
jgi:hypothetical protein